MRNNQVMEFQMLTGRIVLVLLKFYIVPFLTWIFFNSNFSAAKVFHSNKILHYIGHLHNTFGN